MVDQPDLNPKPAANPAAVDAPKTKLPVAAPVNESAAVSDSTAKGAWPGAFAAFSQALERIKKNPQPLLVVVGAYAVLALLAVLMGADLTPDDKGVSGDPTDILNLVFLLALPTYALAVADRHVISVSEFFKFDIGRYFTMLGVVILASLAIVLSIVAFVIPVIWVAAWFANAMFPVIDKRMGVFESLSESKRLAQDNKGKIWGIVGVAILLSLPLAVLAQVPVVAQAYTAFVTVWMYCSIAILYRWLQENISDTAQ